MLVLSKALDVMAWLRFSVPLSTEEAPYDLLDFWRPSLPTNALSLAHLWVEDDAKYRKVLDSQDTLRASYVSFSHLSGQKKQPLVCHGTTNPSWCV